MGEDIALLCLLHPSSALKQERILGLLRQSAREYYRQSKAKCTTWSYFTPHQQFRKKGPPVIGGLEIYTSKSALSAQLNDPVFFQAYHDAVKKEQLYSKPEELVAWYQVGGFAARETNAMPFGDGVVVSVAKVTYRDEGEVNRSVGLMRSFAKWVETDQKRVLTYILFTRPKAPRELLIFARYMDEKAMQQYDESPEHRDIQKRMADIGGLEHVDLTIWKEVEDSFVSNNADIEKHKGASRL